MLGFWRQLLVSLVITIILLTANGAESFVVLESFDEYQTGEFKSQGDWEVLNGDILIAANPDASSEMGHDQRTLGDSDTNVNHILSATEPKEEMKKYDEEASSVRFCIGICSILWICLCPAENGRCGSVDV